MSSHRERLVAFYTKYNPEKMSGVDATLEKFKGREEEMFKALVGKYGPEPGKAAAAAATGGGGGGNYKARLIAFYQKYNPEKISGADATLEKFKGREEEMFKALVGKYGPEPGAAATPAGGNNLSSQPSLSISPSSVQNAGLSSPNGNYKERLIAYYQKYNPEKLSGVDATLDKFKGREEEMFKALVGKYGPEPATGANNTPSQSNNNLSASPTLANVGSAPNAVSASPASYKARLVAFYQKYNPEKISGADATLEKFKGREEEMFKALVGKYGPEPGAGAGGASSASSPTAASSAAPSPLAAAPGSNSSNYYVRLANFYKKYNPGKIGGVEATLEKFKGREEEMFKSLVTKYGPEPAPGDESTASTSTPPIANTPSQPNLSASPTLANVGSASYKDRLIAFYKKYNPEKIPGADATLDKFKGREEEMFKALVAKYGAEPAVATAAAEGATNNNNNNNSNDAEGIRGSGSSLSFRERLVAFYQKYNPEKMSGVDATLQKFSGREEEMFKALTGKYGPEPAVAGGSNNEGGSNNNNNTSGNATPPAQSSPSPSFKDRLIGFYKKYNPEKMSGVDATLEKFKGREEEMFKALVNKYGAEPTPVSSPNANRSLSVPPTAPSPNNTQQQGGDGSAAASDENTFKSRLTRFYQKYAPDKLPKVDAHLAKYAGREEEFFKALVNNYGTEPPATPLNSNLSAPPTQPSQQQQQEPYTTKQRLTAFYQKWAPEKLPKVDDHLTKYSGREEDLFKALVAKYGAEPARPQQQQSNNNNNNNTSDQPMSHKQRFTIFYQKYAPEKIPKVDDQLKKYQGREEELMKALVAKYGAEPPRPATSKSPTASPNQASLASKSPSSKPLNSNNDEADDTTNNNNTRSINNNENDNSNNGLTASAILQAVTQLPPEQAQQKMKEFASNPAFLAIIQSSLTSGGGLGGAAAGSGLERRARALSEEETERREIVDQVQLDEFEILSHMASTSYNKIKSAEESDQLQQKSSQLLRKQHMELWQQYAKDRIKQRRREATAALTPYQRIAFSKSKAGLRSLQRDTGLGSPPGHSSPHFSSPHTGAASPGRTGRSIITKHTQAAPVPMQGLNFSSISNNNNKRAMSTSTTPRNTLSSSRGVSPRAGSSSMMMYNNNNNNRSASSRSSSSQQQTAGRYGMSAAHQNSTINPALLSVRGGKEGLSRVSSQPPSARMNTSRHELAKSRHSAETRVEKLSNNQLSALHRRLEKWGLPVPGFVRSTMSARGVDAYENVSKMNTPRAGAAGGGATHSRSGSKFSNSSNSNTNNNKYSDPNDNNNITSSSAELDAQVMKILEGMHANEHDQDWN